MQKTDKGRHFSYALGYNSNDYTAIGGATPLLGGVGGGLLPTQIATGKNLYNGNILTWASKNSTGASGTLDPTWTQQFTYDQLNRITLGTTQGGTRNYRNAYNYDANGNILSLKRYDLAGAKIDSLVYNYHNVANGYKQITNKLRSVDELATATGRTDDIEDQDTDNYQYDEIGNLIKDDAEEIEKIEWNVQGKIERITRKTGSIKADLAFNYDATGKRISKTVYTKNAQGTINHTTTTYYIHDATGNTMATYNVASDAPTLALQEQSIYGSSSLGLLTLQGKQYELTDHLGNVRTVINENNTVASATDYYPFGMVAKSFSNGYRYGFNGQEKDTELGEGITTAEFWEYDSRLGRRWNLDPKPVTGISDYACFQNNPILNSDPDGDEIKVKRKYGFFRHLFGLKPLIKITVTGVLIDNSSKNLTKTELKEVRDRIEAGIKAGYTGEGTDVKWKGKAKIRVGNRGEKSLRKNDHAFRLYDDGKLPDSNNPGGVRPAGVIGHAPRGERVVELNTGLISTPENERVSMERTSAHELGHSGGMHQEGGVFVGHPNPSTRPDNLMHQSGNPNAGFNLDQDQILQMEKDYKDKKLNKDIHSHIEAKIESNMEN